MKRLIIILIITGIIIFPSTAHAISSNGIVIYTPENLVHDPWEGGIVTLEDNYIVNNNDISHNPRLSQTIDFKIVWKTPEGVTGYQRKAWQLGSQRKTLCF